jgi:hypothetical protein
LAEIQRRNSQRWQEPMNSYCLTIKFNGPPSSMTLFQGMTGEQIVDFLPLTKEEMQGKGININFFSVERLDENGKPVVYQEPESVAILSVEEQAHLAQSQQHGGGQP